MTVRRYDSASRPGKAVRLDNGWLRAPAHLTRVGVFEYRLGNGATRRELRLPEEVFAQDALASFDGVPLTNDHPAPGELTAQNARDYMVGTVSGPRQDGERVLANLLVTDAATVAAIEAGKRELSGGYFCDLDETPGIWTDAAGTAHPYDAIQRGIRGNHVAIVTRGRAGPEARVHLDSSDAVEVNPNPHEDAESMKKIKIDGVEVEVSETVVQLVERERATGVELVQTLKADAATAKTEAEKQTARADAAEAKLAETQAKLDAATKPEAVQALVRERVELETHAREVLGAEAKLDGLSNDDVRKQVIAKVLPGVKLDGKGSEYIAAMYDAAKVKPAPATSAATTEAQRKLDEANKGNGRSDGAPVDPREEYNRKVYGEAYKAPRA